MCFRAGQLTQRVAPDLHRRLRARLKGFACELPAQRLVWWAPASLLSSRRSRREPHRAPNRPDLHRNGRPLEPRRRHKPPARSSSSPSSRRARPRPPRPSRKPAARSSTSRRGRASRSSAPRRPGSSTRCVRRRPSSGAASNHSVGTSRPGMPHRFAEERPATARRAAGTASAAQQAKKSKGNGAARRSPVGHGHDRRHAATAPGATPPARASRWGSSTPASTPATLTWPATSRTR